MPILQSNLQGCFDRLRAAATVENLAKTSTELPQNELSELLERIGSKQIPIRTRELLQLSSNGRVDFPICVPDAECSGPTRSVEIATTGVIKQIAPLAANDAGQLFQAEA